MCASLVSEKGSRGSSEGDAGGVRNHASGRQGVAEHTVFAADRNRSVQSAVARTVGKRSEGVTVVHTIRQTFDSGVRGSGVGVDRHHGAVLALPDRHRVEGHGIFGKDRLNLTSVLCAADRSGQQAVGVPRRIQAARAFVIVTRGRGETPAVAPVVEGVAIVVVGDAVGLALRNLHRMGVAVGVNLIEQSPDKRGLMSGGHRRGDDARDIGAVLRRGAKDLHLHAVFVHPEWLAGRRDSIGHLLRHIGPLALMRVVVVVAGVDVDNIIEVAYRLGEMHAARGVVRADEFQPVAQSGFAKFPVDGANHRNIVGPQVVALRQQAGHVTGGLGEQEYIFDVVQSAFVHQVGE